MKDLLDTFEQAQELLLVAASNAATEVAHIESLCTAYTSSLLGTQDERGRTAVHLSCHHQLSPEVVSYLARKWPGALDSVDIYGMSPLHTACQRSCLEVVNCLTRLAPHLLRKPNRQGRLPLHVAMRRTTQREDETLAIVQYLVEQDHTSLSCCDAAGLSSLYLACIPPNNPLEIVEFIIDRDPNLLLKKSFAGRTPLHCVFSFADWFFEHDLFEEYSQLVMSLIKAQPKILEAVDNDGRTAFDLFPWTNSLFVEHLLQHVVTAMHRFVCGQYHAHGRSILHVALQHGSPVETNGLLELLVKLSPEVFVSQDVVGATPLHVACRCSSDGTIRSLIRVSPDALAITDSLRNYPAAYAIAREGLDVTYFIIRRDPLCVYSHFQGNIGVCGEPPQRLPAKIPTEWVASCNGRPHGCRAV